jgi:hypothetical protein
MNEISEAPHVISMNIYTFAPLNGEGVSPRLKNFIFLTIII